MAIIYTYPLNNNIKGGDVLMGSTEMLINGQRKIVTRNFLLSDLANFINNNGSQGTITLTTNNTNGPSTLDPITGVLNIPIYAGGSVTSVAALTIGTIGTDVTSTVVNSTTTPGITLNIPNASAIARGVITTEAQTIAGSKTFTNLPTIPLIEYGSNTILGVNGSGTLLQLPLSTYPSLAELSYVKGVTSSIQTQINNIGVGGVTSVSAITLGTSGTDLSSTVLNPTTTPVITLNVPNASASNRGVLSTADWTAFNNKQNSITLTTSGVGGVSTLIGNVLNVPNYASSNTTYSEIPEGLINGSNTVFTLTNLPLNSQSLIIVIDGLIQYNGIDYNLALNSNIATFTFAPATGSTMFAYYNFLAGTNLDLSNYAKKTDLIYKADLVIGKNKFNKNSITNGYYINNITGALVSNSTYNTSDYIAVVSGTSYVSSSSIRFSCYFDSNNVVVAGGTNSNITTFTVPAGVSFIRVSINISVNINSFQLEVGTIPTVYEAYNTTVPASQLNLIEYSKISDLSAYAKTSDVLPLLKIQTNRSIFLPNATGTDLLAIDAFILDMKITSSDGSLTPADNLYYHNFDVNSTSTGYKIQLKNDSDVSKFYVGSLVYTPPSNNTRFYDSITFVDGNNTLVLTVNWDNYLVKSSNGSTYAKYKLNNNVLFGTTITNLNIRTTSLENNQVKFDVLNSGDFKVNNGNNLFSYTATLSNEKKAIFERLFNKIKFNQGFISTNSYYFSSFTKINSTSFSLSLRTKNISNIETILLSSKVFTKSKDGIEVFLLKSLSATEDIKISIDWSFYDFNNSLLSLSGTSSGITATLFNNNYLSYTPDLSDNVSALLEIKNLLGVDITTSNPFTTIQSLITLTQQSDGLRYKYNGNGTKLNQSIIIPLLPIDKLRKYAVYLDYTINEFNGVGYENEVSADRFGFSLSYSGLSATGNFTDLNVIKSNYKRTAIIQPLADSGSSNSFLITVANNKLINGLLIDATFHSIMLVDLGFNGDILYDKTEEELTMIFRKTGFFKTTSYINKNEIIPNTQFKGKEIFSYGDSVSLTVVWQGIIAAYTGMKFDKTKAREGDGTNPPTAIGGTTLVPAITSSDPNNSRGINKSIYYRSSFVQNMAAKNDVIFLFAGFNDPKSGTIIGGTTVPTDQGLNDAPYIGEQIDLIANPTATIPSYGACYRGMVQRTITNMPLAKIILFTLYYDSGEVKASKDAMNVVIRKVGEEYGLQVIDLAKWLGVTSFNYTQLLKDSIHPQELAWIKMAQNTIKELI